MVPEFPSRAINRWVLRIFGRRRIYKGVTIGALLVTCVKKFINEFFRVILRLRVAKEYSSEAARLKAIHAKVGLRMQQMDSQR